MRVIQITDSHISRDTPQRAVDLENCIAHVNSVRPVPDLVVHTGDITHGGLPQEYRVARTALDKLGAPYVVMAGNKDERRELTSAFPHNRTLQQEIDNQSNHVDDDSGFIQFCIEDFPVRLIILDTVSYASKGEFCNKRLAQLDALLARDVTRPAVVFMHHAPFEISEIPDPLQFENRADVEALLAVFRKYKQIQSVYCGHIHRNIESMLDALPVSVLTCTACDLRKGKMSETDRQKPMINIIDLPFGW